MSNFLTLLNGIDGNIYSHSFVLDSINNLYTVGYTNAKVIQLGNKKYSRNSTKDVGYIVKVDKKGEVEWFHWIDGTDVLACYSIGVDSLNNIILTGYSSSETVIINNTSYSKSNNTGKDGFVIKISQNGNVIWFKWIEGTRTDIGYKLSVDKNDDIVIVGLSNSEKINNITRPIMYSPKPTAAGFVLKMNGQGDIVWFNWINGAKYDDAFAVILDSDNNIYVTGVSNSTTLVIDKKSYNKINKNQSIYIAKFMPDGHVDWCIWIAGDGIDTVSNIKCDKYNYIYVAGISNSKNITFNQILHERLNDDELFTPFVVKFNSKNMETSWFKWFESDKDTHIYALATDDINNVYIGGTSGANTIYVNDLEFVNANKNTNAFLFKLDSNGEVVWNTWVYDYKNKNNKTTFITNLLVDNNYNIYINGYSDAKDLYFHNTYLYTNNHSFDNAFVIKYNLNDITLENTEISIIIEDNYYKHLFFLIVFILYIYGIWTLYKRGII